MVPLSKSGVRKHRGFESRPLRHPSITAGPIETSSTGAPVSGRGRLVDYGAALEMRFGATRRGFESLPLRQSAEGGRPMRALARPVLAHAPDSALAPVLVRRLRLERPPSAGTTAGLPRPSSLDGESTRVTPRPIQPAAVFFGRRARRGTSGALYLQSAPAGLNSLPRSVLSNAARRCDVEDRVPRSGEPRTVSDPEGSSTKRPSSGAAERPGPSRLSWWAREFPDRRRVHGTSSPRALDRRPS